MRKILITLVAVGVLLSARTASQALTITISAEPGSGPPADWAGALLGSDVNTGTAGDNYIDWLNMTATQTIAPGGFTYAQRAGWYIDSRVYKDPSGPPPVPYLPPYGPHTAVLTNVEADYSLGIYINGNASDKRVVKVFGLLNEDYGWYKGSNPGVDDVPGGDGSYSARVGLGNVEVDGNPINAARVIRGGSEFLYIPLVFAGNQPVNLYLLANKPMSPAYPWGWGTFDFPGSTYPDHYANSLEGYVDTVPEPGSLAMLFGSGVIGTLFLRRRRK
jgi:hypothetical protein